MTLEIESFASGPVLTNAFLVGDPETGRALIVDAPFDATDAVLAAAEEKGWQITEIVITHPHWDHIGDAAMLAERSGAPLVGHPGTATRLAAPDSAPMAAPLEVAPARVARTIDEGDEIVLGAHRFAVWHLPGHEPSHIVLVSQADGVVLGGDVLFPNGHGRIDLPDSDAQEMQRSLRRLAGLPSATRVYPGHGVSTTIGAERWLPGA